MNLDLAVLVFGAFVSLLVLVGIVLAFYAPAYRELARREDLQRGHIPANVGREDAR